MSEPKPANRIRLAYDCDPLTARVELVVMTDDGREEAHDIPCSEAMIYLASDGTSSVILKISEAYLTAHVAGEVDGLLREKLLQAAKLPRRPPTDKEQRATPLTGDGVVQPPIDPSTHQPEGGFMDHDPASPRQRRRNRAR
jgi:hypothetical protein